MTKTAVRGAWIALGGISLALGLIGIVLPLLPTTPFLLLAAFAFTKGSPRLGRWLVAHPRLGPPIQAWRAEGAIAPAGKKLALAVIAASIAGSFVLQAPLWAVAVQLSILVPVSLFIATRPTPTPIPLRRAESEGPQPE